MQGRTNCHRAALCRARSYPYMCLFQLTLNRYRPCHPPPSHQLAPAIPEEPVRNYMAEAASRALSIPSKVRKRKKEGRGWGS